MKRDIAGFFRRNSVSIPLVIITVAFMLILFLLASAQSKIQQQISQQQQIVNQVKGVAEQLNRGAKQRTAQIDQLNRHLDCIVIFFTDANRAQKTIQDIDTCTLKTTATGQVSAPKSDGSSTTPSQPVQSISTPVSSSNTSGIMETAPPAVIPSVPAAPQPDFLQHLLNPVVAPIDNLLNVL